MVKSEDVRTTLMKFEGTLESFWETGMESSLGVIVHDSRGLHEGPHYSDPSKTFMYHSHNWNIWLNKYGRYIIKIFDKDDDVIYNGPLTYSRKKSMELYKEKGLSVFIPEEIDLERWLEIVRNKYRVELFTNDFPDAIMNQYNIKHKVNQLVYDKVSREHVIIYNVFVDNKEKLVYYVSSKLRKGIRCQEDLEHHKLELMEYHNLAAKLREFDNNSEEQ